MEKVSQLECDKLRLIFEPPIGCLTKKEARKERRKVRIVRRREKRKKWFKGFFSI